MFMTVPAYMYVCMYIYIYVCTCIYIYIHVCTQRLHRLLVCSSGSRGARNLCCGRAVIAFAVDVLRKSSWGDSEQNSFSGRAWVFIVITYREAPGLYKLAMNI